MLLLLGQSNADITCKYVNGTQHTLGCFVCDKFDSWREVNDEFNSIKCINSNDTIYLKPSKPILITSELNISLVACSNNQQNSTNQVWFNSVGGINVYPWPALECSDCVKKGFSFFKKMLYFYYSSILFYVNNTQPSEYPCTPDIFPADSSSQVSFFSTYINSIYTNMGNSFGDLAQAVCPYIFKNAKLNGGFALDDQVDSFLFVTLFRFQEVNDTQISTINSSIPNLDIEGYNYKLDTSIIHPLVFESVQIIYCYGTIKSIQTDLFGHFNRLNLVYFNQNSAGNLYHHIGIEWMNYLNSNLYVTITSTNIPYTYPDRDFCIFARFPLGRGITLTLDTNAPNCTLTYAWLCQNAQISRDLCFNWPVNSTTVDALLQLCDLKSNETSQQPGASRYLSYPEIYQTKLINMLFIELVPFVLIPCGCLIGLYLNLKIIRAIKRNKTNKLKEDFYKYMSANAKFNCLYCLIFVFYPMTSCTWKPSYYFCSTIFTTQFVQYYKIIMMAYFGEVFKMCANISYIMMTLNRYILVGKDHAPWLVSIAKLEFKWLIRGSFFVSVLVNIGHGWQYIAIGDLLITYGSTQNSQISGFSYSDYPEANQGTSYFFYSIVYFVINFAVFFILNTGIEVKIVQGMHKELKDKRERHARMNAEKLSRSVDATGLAGTNYEKIHAEKEDAKKERKVIKMVVLNGFFNFMLRAPEMFFWVEYQNIFFSLFKDDSLYTVEENAPGLLNLVVDIGYLTYILTFTTNFIIFYKFNKNFKEAVVFWYSSNPKSSN
jgi:hypothetical protein